MHSYVYFSLTVSQQAAMPLTVLQMAFKMEQACQLPAPVLTMDHVIWDLLERRVELDSLVYGGLRAAPLAVTTA